MPSFSHVSLNCSDPIAVERFYARHFGFVRARVIPLGEEQIVFLRSGNVYLELFGTKVKRSEPAAGNDGPAAPAFATSRSKWTTWTKSWDRWAPMLESPSVRSISMISFRDGARCGWPIPRVTSWR